ncbi:tail assembly chaperone [Mycobacterium phage Bazzle]
MEENKELNDLVGSLFADLIASVRVPEPLQVAPGLVVKNPTKKQANALIKATTEEEAQRIIFGDDYDRAMELFDPQPVQVWNKFMAKYNEHFFGDKDSGKVIYAADIVERYWRAICWDFQTILHVNALDYFAAPCRCGQCREKYGDDVNARYASRRNWDQFIMYYETLLQIRGSFTQSMYLHDPDVIEIQANAKDEDWKAAKPPLFGWTAELDALYFIADQVQAGRVQKADDFKPYPRPELPAEKERKRRKETKVNAGLEAAMARGVEAAKWNYL